MKIPTLTKPAAELFLILALASPFFATVTAKARELGPSLPSKAQSVYVGSLSYVDRPTTEDVLSGKQHWEPVVRVLFCKKGNEWLAFDAPKGCGYPDTITWTAIFNGKPISQIQARGPEAPKYQGWMRGVQNVTSDPKDLPKIRSKSDGFSTWMGVSPYRFLPLASPSNTRNPEAWRTTKLSGAQLKPFLSAFRNRVKAIQCDNPNSNKIVTRNLKFTDSNISYREVFVSKSDDLLVGLALDNDLYRCDGPLDTEWSEHWFYRKKSGAISFLGNAIHPVAPVDFDADNHSEWLFTISGYNRDGYKLIYDSFRKSVEVTWGYH